MTGVRMVSVEQSNTIAVKPEASDYIAVAQLYYRLQSKPHRRSTWLFGILLVSIGVLDIASSLAHGAFPGPGLGIFAAMAFSGGLIALYYYVSIPWRMRRLYREQRYPIETTTVEWDDVRMLVDNPTTKTTAPWAEMTRWLEDSKIFVLDFRGRFLIAIPKRVFADTQDQDAFAELLRTHIGPHGTPRN